MKKTLTAIALVLGLAAASTAAHADTPNWTVSKDKGTCVLSSGGVIPDLNNTPVFVNFDAVGNRTLVTLGGSAIGNGNGSNLKIALVTEEPAATSGVYQPKWGINGPESFVLRPGDQFLAQVARAKILDVLIERIGQFSVSLTGFDGALARFEACKQGVN